MIRYLTSRSELDEMSSSQAICFPASMLEERIVFSDTTEMSKRRRQKRRAEREMPT